MEAVRRNPRALQYVRNQTSEICMEAIGKDGRAIYFVKEQTSEICLAAVRQSRNALGYVKDKTPDIVAAAESHDLGKRYQFTPEKYFKWKEFVQNNDIDCEDICETIRKDLREKGIREENCTMQDIRNILMKHKSTYYYDHIEQICRKIMKKD